MFIHRHLPSPRKLGAVLAVVALTACSRRGTKEAPPPELPSAGADDQYEVALPQPPEPESRELTLQLGADLAKCDVDTPHFFFDTARLRPQDIPGLQRLAECLEAEPFADMDLRLVGRADPRGSKSYNEQLAQQRAEKVRDLLVEYGVSASRIEVSQTGEEKARGDEEAFSYGYDRRVDIVQLQAIHP